VDTRQVCYPLDHEIRFLCFTDYGVGETLFLLGGGGVVYVRSHTTHTMIILESVKLHGCINQVILIKELINLDPVQ
jgi:hypothetical protein